MILVYCNCSFMSFSSFMCSLGSSDRASMARFEMSLVIYFLGIVPPLGITVMKKRYRDPLIFSYLPLLTLVVIFFNILNDSIEYVELALWCTETSGWLLDSKISILKYLIWAHPQSFECKLKTSQYRVQRAYNSSRHS